MIPLRRVCTASLALALGAAALAAPSTALDTTPRLAVISAFAPEVKVLLGKTQGAKTYSANGVEFTTGQLGGQDVVLMLSGVSMVNTAMNTQLLLDRFNVTGLVFSGIAGGVDPSLHIGDVTVPGRWGQYQEAVFARETGGGYTLPGGFKQVFPNYGMVFPQNVNVRSTAKPGGEEKFWFDADPKMVEVARTLAPRVTLARCTAQNTCLTQAPRLVVGGNGVSGQTFVDNAAFREYAQKTFGARVLDMETAAVGTVAYANGVPFVAFRSLSDLAGGGPGENEMGTFFQLAADNSAAVVIAFLEAW